MIITSLFYCCEYEYMDEYMDGYMNIRMIGENSMKHHDLKKKKFYSQLNMEDITMQITHTQKEFVKVLK